MNEIALIIDGEVVDIIKAEDRLTAILLSDPTIVDISGINTNTVTSVMVGYRYDSATNTFTAV